MYPLPFFKPQKGLIGHLAGGVQLSGIIAAASGAYSTATIGASDPGGLGLLAAGTPTAGRPDQVADANYGAPHQFLQWFNKAAFAGVPVGQNRPGNAKVQNILGPGYQVWNLTIAKNTRLRDNVLFQLRAEAYNAFNHTNFNAISTVVGATNYGQVTSTGDPRTMQVGAKFTF